MRGIKVINNISWLIFDRVFALVISLIVTVRIANYYGPLEYGTYQYAVSINILLGIFVVFVDGRVIQKHFKDKNKDQGNIIFNTTIAKIILSIISFIVGIVVLLVINKGIKFSIIFLIILINNVSINFIFGIQNYFEYNLKSKNVVIAANIATIISSILQLIMISLNFSIISIVTIILFSSLLKILIMYYQFKKSYKIKIDTKVDKLLIYSIIRESIPLGVAAAAATIYTRIDQVMIGSMLNISDVGIYSISNQMIGIVAIAISPIQTSIFPKMIEWYNSDRNIYYKKYLVITSLATWTYIIGTIFSVLIAPILFNRFFSLAYIKSLEVFNIQILGAFFMYNAALRSSHFTLINQGRVLMISQIIAVIINASLNYIFIPRFGLYGAAWATVATQFISLFISNLFFKEAKNIFGIQLKAINPYYLTKAKKLW